MKTASAELKDRFLKKVIPQYRNLKKDWYITVDSNTYAFGVHWSSRIAKATFARWHGFLRTLQHSRTKWPDGCYHKAGKLSWHISDQEMSKKKSLPCLSWGT